ncbi:MAG TPA: hypothetical protein VLF91_04310 [Candidatus Saccharimonadales bacterium]|nr:hypothetical protein [Candidatus Saccharimonadales bacterium]
MLQQLAERLGITSYDKRLLRLLLLPSWVSGCLCVVVALGTAVGVIISSNYEGSLLEQQIHYWRSLHTSSDVAYDASSSFTLGNVFNTAALFVLWALFGLVLYLTVAGLLAALRSAHEVAEETHYVHATRRSVLITVGLHLVVRVGIVAGWFAYLRFFFGVILLHSLSWLYAAAANPTTAAGVGNAVLAVVVLTVSLHAHVVLLRLLLLRVRVFNSGEYL